MNAHEWDATVAGLRVTVRVREDELGEPCALSASIGAPGNPLGVMLDTICASITTSLRAGVPLVVFLKGLRGQRDDTGGPTNDPDVPMCSSVVDYVARSLAARYSS